MKIGQFIRCGNFIDFSETSCRSQMKHCMYIYIYMYICIRVCVCVCACVRVCVCASVCVCVMFDFSLIVFLIENILSTRK